MNLKEVEEELRQHGHAVRSGTLDQVTRRVALFSRWNAVTDQDGRVIQKISPHPQNEARDQTLSAIYGLERFPLHTDAAHRENPPDIVVLHSGAPNATRTLLWRINDRMPDCVSTGLFTVRGSKRGFLSPAWNGKRLRMDPGCMRPADHLAEEARKFFAEELESATAHEWTAPDTLLFIDNRKALHARDAVIDVMDRTERSLSRSAFVTKEKSE